MNVDQDFVAFTSIHKTNRINTKNKLLSNMLETSDDTFFHASSFVKTTYKHELLMLSLASEIQQIDFN